MPGFSIKQMNQAKAPGTIIVVLSGEMTIQNAEEIRNALVEGFTNVDMLNLEMSNVTAVDLAGLQLLCAAHRTSITENKRFSVTGMDSDQVKSVIRAAGFLRHTGCVEDVEKTCIWVGGENSCQK